MHRIATSSLSSVAGSGDDLTPQILVEDAVAACLLLAACAEVSPHAVIHAPSGETTASVLHHLSSRAPRRIAPAAAMASLRAVRLATRASSHAELNVQCLRMLWLGQEQRRGWLDDRLEPSPCSAWEALAADLDAEALVSQ